MRFRLITSGILTGLFLVGLMSSPVSAQVVTGQDDFGVGFDNVDGCLIPAGGNQMFSTRVLTPNNECNIGFGGVPGTFGGSNFDVFGITDRNILFDVADDSAGSFPPDSFGFAGDTGSAEDCGNFIVLADVQNDENPSGLVTAVWTFDVTGGYNIHRVSVDAIAYGDFEGPSKTGTADEMLISGGVTTDSPLFDFSLTEKQDAADTLYQVVMDSGASYDTFFAPFFESDDWDCLIAAMSVPAACPGGTVEFHPADDGGAGDDGTPNNGFILQPTFSNPTNTVRAYRITSGFGTFNETEQLPYRDPLIEQNSGTPLDNTKKTFTAIVKESGDTFTLNMVATQNSGPEIIALDNILLESAVLGDANDDGVFNNQDIASFVLALTDGKTYGMMFPNVDTDFVLDMNCDGIFDNTDIAAFVEALTGN